MSNLPIFTRTVDDRVRELECVISDLTEQAKEDHKKIAELEGYNIGLANENHAQAKRIAELDVICKDIFNDFSEDEILLEPPSIQYAWAEGKALEGE